MDKTDIMDMDFALYELECVAANLNCVHGGISPLIPDETIKDGIFCVCTTLNTVTKKLRKQYDSIFEQYMALKKGCEQ